VTDRSFTAPHHDGSPSYVSRRSPALGDDVTLTTWTPVDDGVEQMHVRTVIDGEPKHIAAKLDARTERGVRWKVDLRVTNPQQPYRFLLDGGSRGYRWLTAAGVVDHDVPDATDFWLASSPAPPHWLDDTVAYQVFPDRFARAGASDDWPDWATRAEWDKPIHDNWRVSTKQLYGGDLPGIAQRLDHIERLGANLLYLTPVFPARSAHRYDATTFDHIDPFLGGDGAYAALIAAAHDRGIRVVGDLTTNHTGNHHDWFTRAQADAESAEASFYVFHHHPDDYLAWFDVPTLPKLDHRAELLRQRFFEGADCVVARWMHQPFGLDGWRVDVANMTGRHGAVDVNHDVARAMRRAMAAVNSDSWLVAEHCYDASRDLMGDGWHGTMAYSGFTRPVWSWLGGPDRSIGLMGFPGGPPVQSGRQMAAVMQRFAATMPWRSLNASMTLLDSHDTARFASVADDRDAHIAGLAMLMCYPGVPSVFAGSEVGVRGRTGDEGRQPFPWDESRWDAPLLDAHRALIGLRRSQPALQHGGLRWLASSDHSVAFARDTDDETLVIEVWRDGGGPVPTDAAADVLFEHGGACGARVTRAAGR
jgi:alpha-glucosidase